MNADCESKLIIDGWKIGFEKIQFTKMLREELGLGLLEAKTITDTVLDRKRVELRIGGQDRDRIARRAMELGALVVTRDGEITCR
jgi:ribosomal protein L7/L12